MKLNARQLIARGRYAHIFESDVPERVLKLFRTKPLDPHGVAVKAIFEAEVSAYRHLQKCPDLLAHAPEFYGTRVIENVIDNYDASIASCYLMTCCYEVERMHGDDRKIHELPEESWPLLEPLFDRFTACDLEAGDASVFGWKEPATAKLIDFSLGDASAVYSHLLFNKHGQLVE